MDKQQIELQGHRALVEEVCGLAEQVQALTERVRRLENAAMPSGRRTGKVVCTGTHLGQEPTKGDRAAEWLITFLSEASEPVSPQMAVEAAEAAGFSRAMIYRARETLDRQIVNSLGRKHPQNCWMLRREVVADLGHGWRIERQPAPPNADGATYTPTPSHVALETGTPYPVAATGTPGDSCLPVADCWVTQFAAAVDGF